MAKSGQRKSIGERALKKIILQRQLRDIGVQRRQVQRRGGIARRAEHVRSALKQLAAPPGDLVGMQFVLLGHFSGPCVVWDLLSDPRAVVGCVPGAALGEEHEDGTFDGTLTVEFAPTKVTFVPELKLHLIRPRWRVASACEAKTIKAERCFAQP